MVSALVWVPSALLLYADAITYRRYAAAAPHALISLPTRSHEYYVIAIGVPLCLSLSGVVTGIGLLGLRNWARITTLSMATLPVCGCALFLGLYHPRNIQGAIFVVGDLLPTIAWAFLAVLLPVSVWWWLLFTRKTVRSRFR